MIHTYPHSGNFQSGSKRFSFVIFLVVIIALLGGGGIKVNNSVTLRENNRELKIPVFNSISLSVYSKISIITLKPFIIMAVLHFI
jgi:hypothetical protein